MNDLEINLISYLQKHDEVEKDLQKRELENKERPR